MIGLLLLELLRFLYFREFLILRANIDEIEKIKKTDLLSDCAYLLSKFGQNRSSRFRDIAGTNFVTNERTDERNIDEIEKIKKTDLLHDCADLLSIFGQNRSSRF